MCLFSPFTAGRYHSLVIDKDSFPHEELEITAWTEDGLIMAARHKKYRHIQVRVFVFFSLVELMRRHLVNLMIDATGIFISFFGQKTIIHQTISKLDKLYFSTNYKCA